MGPVGNDSQRGPSAVVLLGAQRFDSTLGAVVRDLHCAGPIALITTGWREREDEDERLRAHLECETINLRLYHRGEEVFASDPELSKTHRAKQAKLRHKQDFYRIRLEHELAANRVIRQLHAPPDVLAEEEGASVSAIRQLDAYHLAQCRRVSAEFDVALGLRERPSVMQHREQIAEALSRCKGIAIAGGHVAALINRMRLFGLDELIDGQAVFAWSGGGMAISERIVLFHDYPPQGRGAAEILDEGLVRDVVVLPQPETRLRMHDPERVSLLARRFDPATCLALPQGAHVIVQDGKFGRSADVIHLLPDGSCPPFQEHAA
jgi:peptidase E